MTRPTHSNPSGQLPGGDPTRLSKPIQLCSSIDNDTANVFNGFLAHLSLFPEVRRGGGISVSCLRWQCVAWVP